jgi:hypothetical protein
MKLVRVRVRRWMGGVGVVLVLILGVRLIWGWRVVRELDALKAEARGRGEMVEVGDLEDPSVPDDENAWYWQTRAAGAVSWKFDSPRNSNIDYPDYPPYSKEWWKLAEASEKGNAQAFVWARRAREFDQVRLREPLKSPILFKIFGSGLNDAKLLANTVTDGALYSHLKGSDGEALERWRDVWHIARSLHRDDFLVTQLVAIGVESIDCEAIEVMAPGLRLTAHSPGREQARRIIDELLAEKSAKEGVRRGLLGERVILVDEAEARTRGTWAISPLAQRDLVRGFYNFRVTIDAAGEENWPRARAAMAGYRADWEASPLNPSFMFGGSSKLNKGVPRYSRWFGLAEGGLRNYLERNFRILAERRLAAVDLAWQMYRADHGGKWPGKLEELVPLYLKEVPKDPFHDNGRGIGYVVFRGKLRLPDGGDRPMLYFDAGEVDEGVPSEPTYDWHQRKAAVRQYRDLTLFVPENGASDGQ